MALVSGVTVIPARTQSQRQRRWTQSQQSPGPPAIVTQEETAGEGDYKKYGAVYENKYLAIIYRKLCKSTYYYSLVYLLLNGRATSDR